MPYDEKLLNGFVLLVDAQGGAGDDVAAPDAGQTLLYTTEQGLVAERPAPEGFSAPQWFLDQPTLLDGYTEGGLTDTPISILAEPYTIPDAIDANFPTFYRLEGVVSVENFSQDANSVGIWVAPYVDGSQQAYPIIIPCDPSTGDGGACVTFFVTGVSGLEIDLRAKLLNSNDGANVSFIGVIKREMRISGGF